MNLRYWFNNVFKVKTHKLTSGGKIRLGQWCDLDRRIFYCVFNSFEEFVENELGLDRLDQIISEEGKLWSEVYPNIKYDCEIHPYGVDEYKEIKALYQWWKERKNINDNDLETDPYDSDTEMLVRLMKARRALWTQDILKLNPRD